MLKDSFWWPSSSSRGVVLAAVVLMIPLHQSELLGLLDSQVLLFDWLPMQLGYDILFNLIGAVILYAMYRLAPEPPASALAESSTAVSESAVEQDAPEVNADG
ncbi:hypothetical protein [Haloarchaeobius sp. DYHT-AS-18]|uniref:hypothetical protein n=1 Tax=Haloarchaeobius sp. DYHT-AS-18 TaxID=3446117 RepID=UPI003EBB1A8A